jgi:chromosome segregation ATPase
MTIMPNAYLDIAARLGYQVDKVGDRRVINCKAALATHSGTSITGGGAKAGSATSQEASLEVVQSSSFSQDLQNALTLFGQKEQALSEQVVSLQGLVSALTAGQSSLQRKQEVLQGQLTAQASNSLAILKNLAQLRTDFEKTRDKHERTFAENTDKYEATMAEIQKQLGVVGTGVKGPHDTEMPPNE